MSPVMYDSTDPNAIPASGADAVAGYVGGNWTTWPAIKARFPNLPKLSIAVNASEDAQCLDVETGDATPADVPGWLDRHDAKHPSETPVIYCPASRISEVRAAAGSRTYLLWSAHYLAGEHICGPGRCQFPAADATQWADSGPHGEHIDQTLMTANFLAAIGGTNPAEADMQEADVINMLHEAAERSTAAGRQVSDYLRKASGVTDVLAAIADLPAAVAKALPASSGGLSQADVEAAIKAVIKSTSLNPGA